MTRKSVTRKGETRKREIRKTQKEGTMKRNTLFALLLAFAVVASACSSTGTDDTSAGDTSTTAATPQTTEAPPAPAEWYPYAIEVWDPPFDMESPRTTVDYVPLDAASEPWEICVSFPHMKDAYWLAVDYGVASEAERLGVAMHLVEAGGYTELANQLSQIEDCVAGGADAVVIGAISFDGLNNLVSEITAQGVPVVDVINGMSSTDLGAKSLVSFGEMGAKAGGFLADLVADDADPAKVAWFPGPSGAGWVEAGNTGFMGAVEDANLVVVDTKYGDTGKEVQGQLVEDTLQANPDLQYIVGTAVTAEAAVSIVRDLGLEDKVQIISYYFTPGVFEGLQQGRILAAPSDSPVIQGRVAIDQAVRILEGEDFIQHAGPALFVVSDENLETFDRSGSLAPDGWKPVFNVGG